VKSVLALVIGPLVAAAGLVSIIFAGRARFR
jgi:hypothetical protein